MRVRFNINFKTEWGQTMFLFLHSTSADAESQAIPMRCNQISDWTLELEPDANTRFLSYQYAFQDANQKEFHFEFGDPRRVSLQVDQSEIVLMDNWRASYGDSPFFTAAFTDCFFRREETYSLQEAEGNLIIRMNCPQMEPGRHFAIVGNQACLGNWDVSGKIRLDDTQYPVWSVALDSTQLTFPLEYKYLIVDSNSDEVLAWGGGPNRSLSNASDDVCTIINDEHFIRTIPSWRGAGVAIPVFSLRSENGFGIGEFYDLKLMVDWAKSTGQRIIQTLPINDTILYHTNYDSYPYNAVSVYALHPVYLNLDAIGKLKSKKQRDYFSAKAKELNQLSFSDYQHVMNAKWEFFKLIFQQEKDAVFASEDYRTFFEKNEEWLVPYAAFSYLRDLYGTPSFSEWPEHSIFNKEEIYRLADAGNSHFPDLSIFYFLQYHLHKQLVEVHDYARASGIAIKGDIPIGVSPRSVDAWVEPELFNTNLQAGAPPDDFSITGQNWGFPTYNWALMARDGYMWWKKRFQKLAEYFDAYRIDHILGFFRIWGIPADAVWGLTGSFQPALPLTVDELEAKGVAWDNDRFLKPYLKEHVLYSVFGKYTDDVIREFLLPDGYQNYKFKPEFDTQKKIEKHFSSLGYEFGTKDVLIRDGLYQLHCEVLFVRDVHQPERFHPRISMHDSASFRDLPDHLRRTLNAIYVDFYYHRHTEFWKDEALKKLPALISATNMLVCGEDLGMVPDSVPEVMNRLEILSLEIQRMPKKPNTEFAMPADAPYRSVCTTSTHDMNPIRAWWEEDPELTRRFYSLGLNMQGPPPAVCQSWIAERIVEQHLKSPAMLVILPWQDWLAMEGRLCHKHPFAERINVPSNPRNFWCYRMHMTLEDLLKEDKFNRKINNMIIASGR